ncbi:hypothetical protein ACFL2V_08960 [Pseudomonadota bacterium]
MNIFHTVVRWRFAALAAVSLLLLVATTSPAGEFFSDWFQQNNIVKVNVDYLAQSQKDAEHHFVLLAELEAFLAVLQSSQVGISFIANMEVSIGHALEPLSKLVADAAGVTLLATISTEVLMLLLSIAELVSPWLFSLFLAGIVFYGIVRQLNLHIDRANYLSITMIEIVGMLFIVFHLLVPYSIYGAAQTAHYLSSHAKQENWQTLNNMHEDITQNKHKAGLKARAENAIHSFEKATVDISHKVESMARYYTTQLTLVVIEHIVLPIVLLLMMGLIARKAMVTLSRLMSPVNHDGTVISVREQGA